MRASDRRVQRLQGLRAAFTLIEMLISVTLVLLMMTMFTSVFQMATESLSKQRSIAASDQKLRSMTTTLRADFAKRSARQVFPFLPDERASTTKFPFNGRPGYVYISCNDPASGQDDLIQFTVDSRQIQTNTDTTRYYGRSKLLIDQTAVINGSPTTTSLLANPNQPDADDGTMVSNGVAGSNAAEICYFLRGGNLIRRTMLLRDPLPVAGADLEAQPKSIQPGNEYFVANVGGGSFTVVENPNAIVDPTITPPPGSWGAVTTNDFWQHFDFSAVPQNALILPVNLANTPNDVEFVGIGALSNEPTANSLSLGLPFFRFGFNPVNGLSREHSGTTTPQFIGRYLHAETSHPDFNWPIAISSIGNPMDVNNAVTLNTNTGIVTDFQGSLLRGGERRIEDVVQTGVQEFRVELWDDRLERYVVPGHDMTKTLVSGGTSFVIHGDYHISRNAQFDANSTKITYGPLQLTAALSGTPHVFDTWHPRAALGVNLGRRDFDGDAISDIAEQQAPYYSLKYYPPKQNGTVVRSTTVQLGPSSVNLPDPNAEFDPLAFDSGTGLLGRGDANQGVWEPNTQYTRGDIVFGLKEITSPLVRGWDSDNNGVFDWVVDSTETFVPPIVKPVIPNESLHRVYRCLGNTSGGDTGTSNSSLPGWKEPGLRFTDNDLVWEGFDNFQPLKSIRLTIRFIDESSQQPKQLSLIMPMADPE
jgi:type II secretory pathway pseudopilin PulG